MQIIPFLSFLCIYCTVVFKNNKIVWNENWITVRTLITTGGPCYLINSLLNSYLQNIKRHIRELTLFSYLFSFNSWSFTVIFVIFFNIIFWYLVCKEIEHLERCLNCLFWHALSQCVLRLVSNSWLIFDLNLRFIWRFNCFIKSEMIKVTGMFPKNDYCKSDTSRHRNLFINKLVLISKLVVKTFLGKNLLDKYVIEIVDQLNCAIFRFRMRKLQAWKGWMLQKEWQCFQRYAG